MKNKDRYRYKRRSKYDKNGQKRRDLRARGGGISRSRSSYFSSSSSKVSASYRYSYSTTKTAPATSNSYWDGGRTYKPLYAYYRPTGYTSATGYYSTTFLLIYYNGYGYNFYYGGYGYYEYSVHPEDTSTQDMWFSIFSGSCTLCLICFACYQCCTEIHEEVEAEEREKKNKELALEMVVAQQSREEEESDISENRPYDPNKAAYPEGYDGNTAPPDQPPGMQSEAISGYTMTGVVLGVPVEEPHTEMNLHSE